MHNFTFLEQHRLKLLKLFVATSILLLVGAILLLNANASHWLTLPLTITMTLLSLCFWWIDRQSVAAIKRFELAQEELEQGGTQLTKGDAKTTGGCCCLDGYVCIHILGTVLGVYFSVMPFFVQLQPVNAPTANMGNPKPINQAPAQIRPINQMPQAMTPLPRPNFAPMPVMPSAHPPAQIRPLTSPTKPQ